MSASVVLDRLPLPPSSNTAYMPKANKKTGRVYFAPTKELEQYERAIDDWRRSHLNLANAARNYLVSRLPEHQLLIRIDRYFAFRRDRIWTLAGRPKKLDASNRIKLLDDALATRVLALDDCWFWSGLAEKVEVAPNEPECALVVLTPIQPRTLQELRGYGDPTQAPPVVRQIQAAIALGAPVRNTAPLE